MTAPPRSPIVGIDLGTTNSVCALFESGDVRFIDNALGQSITPSVVAMDRKAKALVVGRTAKDIFAAAPQYAATMFKRAMGTEQTFSVGGRKMTPVELSGYVLDSLRADAEQALGCPVNRCVVTVPAYFNDAQRFATKRAAQLAGFHVERVLNEPTAAALAYGLHRGDEESRFLVFDLGGGTFDVCVMELFEGMLAVKSVAGESQLGGEDFTAALIELGCRKAGLDVDKVREVDVDAWALLYKRGEMLKRQLSSWAAGELTVPPVKGLAAEARAVPISVPEAEQAWAPLLDRLLGPCRAAMRGAELEPADLSAVILVGGATRMPSVRRFAEQTFGRAPMDELDPDLVVAHGAAVQAAFCAQDAAVEDMVVTDVASHSMGVDFSREIGGSYRDGYFTPIIHRNTVIPTSRKQVFSPVHDGQTGMCFGIYEGEARLAKDNVKIGELDIKTKALKKDEPAVEVTFTYDLNGILEVEATVIATGAKVAKVFRRAGSKLDGKALDRATDRLQRLKADPRQRPRYRDLLARANLVWKDADELQRSALTRPMDLFDVALDARDAAAMEEAYRLLLEACEQLDKGERW